MPSPIVYEHVGVLTHLTTGVETTVRLRPCKYFWLTPKGWRYRKDTGYAPRYRKEYNPAPNDYADYRLDLDTVQQVPPVKIKQPQHPKKQKNHPRQPSPKEPHDAQTHPENLL